ncbi:Protein GVQW1, partial [Plecturocebus cupreus]
MRRFVFALLMSETGFCHVGQAGLELLTSDNLPASASQSAGITDVTHWAWPALTISRGKLPKDLTGDESLDVDEVGIGLDGAENMGQDGERDGLCATGSPKYCMKTAIADGGEYGHISWEALLLVREASLSQCPHHNAAPPDNDLVEQPSRQGLAATFKPQTSPGTIWRFKTTAQTQGLVPICSFGWHAMAQPRFTAISTSQVPAILLPQPSDSWDYRHPPPHPANF